MTCGTINRQHTWSYFTSYIRGPSASALSTHLPVTTTSAPSSRARAMGTALFQRQKFNCKSKRKKRYHNNKLQSLCDGKSSVSMPKVSVMQWKRACMHYHFNARALFDLHCNSSKSALMPVQCACTFSLQVAKTSQFIDSPKHQNESFLP